MAAFPPATVYSSVRDHPTAAMNAPSVPASTHPWPSSQTSVPADSPSSAIRQHDTNYPPANSAGERFDYAAATPTDYAPGYPPQSSNALPPPSANLNLDQVDSSIGPSRVLTRRAAKMAQQSKAPPSTPGTVSGFLITRRLSDADHGAADFHLLCLHPRLTRGFA
jgi:hypothetical protein